MAKRKTLNKGLGRQKKGIAVMLGNIGEKRIDNPELILAEKSIRLAKRMPGTLIVGFDIKNLLMNKGQKKPENLMQIKKDFKEGLELLAKNSVSFIESNIALGHYDSKGKEWIPLSGTKPKLKDSSLIYTRNVLKTAYKKLKTGGKLKIVVDEKVLGMMKKALSKSPFKSDKIRIWKMDTRKKGGTQWIRIYKRLGKQLYRIVAEK